MGKAGDVWQVEVRDDGVRFMRLFDGAPIETYGVVSKEKAAVYAAAITQGFEPPRALLGQGKVSVDDVEPCSSITDIIRAVLVIERRPGGLLSV